MLRKIEKKNPPRVTSRNISFNKCTLIFFVSNDSVASYDIHRKTTFFRGASGDLLSLAQFSIFCNQNVGKHCSNVALLNRNWLNELTLSVSSKKILKKMPFFHWIYLPPPPQASFYYLDKERWFSRIFSLTTTLYN